MRKQILDVAIDLLSKRERNMPRGETPFVTAQEVHDNLPQGCDASLSEVSIILAANLTGKRCEIQMGADTFYVTRFTLS